MVKKKISIAQKQIHTEKKWVLSIPVSLFKELWFSGVDYDDVKEIPPIRAYHVLHADITGKGEETKGWDYGKLVTLMTSGLYLKCLFQIVRKEMLLSLWHSKQLKKMRVGAISFF